MIYQKRGKWYIRKGGQIQKFSSESEAKVAMGIVEKPLDPLTALRAEAPIYNTFEDAMDEHGEDEDDLAEEE